MPRAFVALLVALALAPSAPAAQGGARAGEKASPPARAAPDARAPAQPSPAAERVSRALTTPESWDETVGAYATALSSQISSAMEAQGGDAPRDVEKRVRTGLDAAVDYEEVVRLQAQALAGRFAEDELRAIGTFYESAPGKKLVAELPGVSRQVIEIVQQRISAALPRILQQVAPSLARSRPERGAGSVGGDPRDAPPAGERAPAPPPPRK